MQLKIFENKDVKQVYEFIHITKGKEVYVSPYLHHADISFEYIKHVLFNYSSLFIGNEINGDIKNLVQLETPNEFYRTKTIKIKFLCMEKIIFMSEILKLICQDFNDYNKICIYCTNSHRDIITKLQEIGFEKELNLKNEINKNDDVLVYSKELMK